VNFEYLNSSYVVVCCGNILRGDDGVGSFFFKKYSNTLTCIDAGGGTSTVLHMVACTDNNISQLVIVDGGDFNGTPGEIRMVTKEDLNHIEMYRKLPSNISVTAVVIQVKNTQVHYGLSPELKDKLPAVYHMVTTLLEGIP
jgi:Ni,Fe-hydrogenase maturation factor